MCVTQVEEPETAAVRDYLAAYRGFSETLSVVLRRTGAPETEPDELSETLTQLHKLTEQAPRSVGFLDIILRVTS